MGSRLTILPKYPPLNKPNEFNNHYYMYWKQITTTTTTTIIIIIIIIIKDFVEATDVDIWELVEDGYDLPKTPKPKSLWTKEQMKKHLLASKVKWIIFNFLSFDEFEWVSNCVLAKEILDTLDMTHVVATQVKDSKVHVLGS